MAQYVIRPIPLVVGAEGLDVKLYRTHPGISIPNCISVFYIEGPKRNILVDSGCDADKLNKLGFIGPKQVQTMEQGLAKLGLKPEDIDIVIQTHLHVDHYGFAEVLTNAKFLIQKAELEHHRNPPPYEPRPCPKEILDKLNWEVIEGDYQVEEGIKLYFTPGHTVGGMSVAIDTAKGLAIIPGMCSIDENFNPPEKVMPWTGPVAIGLIISDPEAYYQNMLRMKQMADIIVPNTELRWLWTDRIP